MLENRAIPRHCGQNWTMKLDPTEKLAIDPINFDAQSASYLEISVQTK